MKTALREQAMRLRLEKQMSYLAIRKELGVSKSTLSYWLREHPLSEKKILELRRVGWGKGEASRERYRNTMRKKHEERVDEIYKEQKTKFKKISKQSLFVAGLMLYLGEGAKKDSYNITLANTDPTIIQFFIKWMKEFLGIERKYIRPQLHLYENMDIKKETKFWENILGIKEDRFYKTQIRLLRPASFTYKSSYNHGTCQVNFCNREKKEELMMAIKAFTDLYLKTNK